LESALGMQSTLIKGSGGVFDVHFDGELIFSKKASGRFPAPDEIESAIAARKPA
jgi:selT/selW/selH-like putative selenoprotein